MSKCSKLIAAFALKEVMTSKTLNSEEGKIKYARRHLKAISDNGYIYDVAKEYKSLYDIVTK